MRKLRNFLSIFFLFASAHAGTLNCQFDPTTSACTIVSLFSVNMINEAISVPGAPFSPYVDSNPGTIYLNANNAIGIYEFPQYLFNIFTKINSFNAQNISMTELPTDAFFNCDVLTIIQFTNCNIGHIRANFASTCHQLTTLYIEQSPIQSIDENAFQGLYNLQYLTLYKNFLTCVPPMLLQPAVKLETVIISYNNLNAIHSQTFAYLEKLAIVDLGYNQISYIPNFNLNQTGINSRYNEWNSLGMYFYDNPIIAIDPLFMTALYYGRMDGNTNYVAVNFYPYSPGVMSAMCIDPNYKTLTSYAGDAYSIGRKNPDWMSQNTFYDKSTTCYSAFTAQMASESLVTCGFFITTSTTLSTTVTTSTSTLPPTKSSDITIPPVQCATDKICRYYLDWNNQYTCVIDGAEGTVTSIAGNHYLTYTDLDLTRLYFINSHLSLIPKIIFQKFPNLKFLHTVNSGMTVINDQTFNECGNLELWDASDNDISRVDETSLRNCTSLRIIDLTGNPIDFISQGLYQLDPALERIHLTRLDDWTLA